jgi:hypothetical protein
VIIVVIEIIVVEVWGGGGVGRGWERLESLGMGRRMNGGPI